jgi:hypothetical protein
VSPVCGEVLLQLLQLVDVLKLLLVAPVHVQLRTTASTGAKFIKKSEEKATRKATPKFKSFLIIILFSSFLFL